MADDLKYRLLARALTLVRNLRGERPNLSLIASFVAAKLSTPDGPARGLRANAAPFLIARTAGWVAHAREQFAASY